MSGLPLRPLDRPVRTADAELPRWVRALMDDSSLLNPARPERSGPEGGGLPDFKQILKKDSEERLMFSSRPEAMGENLVDRAGKGLFPRPLLITPEPLIHLVHLLQAGRSVLLRGEAGTGKNFLLWQLAVAMARRPEGFPQSLAARPLYFMHPAAFQEGVLYMHEFETKVRTVATDLLQRNAILALDQGWLMVWAGARAEHDDRTLANLLLPWMDRGLQLVVLCLPHLADRMRTQNPAFTDRLTPLELHPWTEAQTSRLLKLLATDRSPDPNLEREAVTVARLFLKGTMPGSAARLMEEATAIGAGRPSLDHLYLAAHRRTGLQLRLLDPRLSLSHEEVRSALERAVYGQEEAVEAVADVIVALKARLIPEGAPLAVLLFVGPTGVGKTRLAEEIAAFLFGSPDRLVRWDMGSLAGPSGLSRFLGEDGRPTELHRVAARAPVVCLFDEIEKTDSYLLDALLSILDEGRILDGRGNPVSFAGSVIVLTGNVGSELFRQRRPGFLTDTPEPALTHSILQQLEARFRPEFLNRIHRIVVFRPLNEEAVRRIARREIEAIRNRIERLFAGLRVEVDEEVVELCMREGFDPTYGARPMRRAVSRLVTTPLARHLAAHPRCQGLLRVVPGKQEAVHA